MTQEELAQAIDRAVEGFSSLTGVEDELANRLVEEGFLSYDDLSIIEPDALMTMGNLSEEAATEIISQAEARAEVAEVAAAEARRQKREQERLSELAAEAGMTLVPADREAGDQTQEADAAEAAAADEGEASLGMDDEAERAEVDESGAEDSDAAEGTTHEPTESAT
jgi:N utilization substance protein A